MFQELMLIKIYELYTICLKFDFWIVLKRIKLIRPMKHDNFWALHHLFFDFRVFILPTLDSSSMFV